VIRNLKRYELESNRALTHVNYSLENVNALSKELLKLIDFKTGCFFTLLLDNSSLERLYEFETGLILPQNPDMQYMLAESSSTYSIIPTMHNEIANFIFKKMQNNNRLICIFDDILSSPSEFYLKERTEKEYTVFCSEEVYYQIKNKQSNTEIIAKYIERSNANWHSLCILTTQGFTNDKEMSLKQIEKTCLCTQLIMIAAYDGEGYIFWEKYPGPISN